MYEITKLAYRVSEAEVIRARNQVMTYFAGARNMFICDIVIFARMYTLNQIFSEIFVKFEINSTASSV